MHGKCVDTLRIFSGNAKLKICQRALKAYCMTSHQKRYYATSFFSFRHQCCVIVAYTRCMRECVYGKCVLLFYSIVCMSVQKMLLLAGVYFCIYYYNIIREAFFVNLN